MPRSLKKMLQLQAAAEASKAARAASRLQHERQQPRGQQQQQQQQAAGSQAGPEPAPVQQQQQQQRDGTAANAGAHTGPATQRAPGRPGKQQQQPALAVDPFAERQKKLKARKKEFLTKKKLKKRGCAVHADLAVGDKEQEVQRRGEALRPAFGEVADQASAPAAGPQPACAARRAGVPPPPRAAGKPDAHARRSRWRPTSSGSTGWRMRAAGRPATAAPRCSRSSCCLRSARRRPRSSSAGVRRRRCFACSWWRRTASRSGRSS